MWAGKSTDLLRRARRYAVSKKSVVVITHKKDVRSGPEITIATHDEVPTLRTTSFQVHAVGKLSGRRAGEAVASADVVAIDEAQWFEDLAEVCNRWADSGKIVIVAALDTTYKREPWKSVSQLCPDFITKLTAVCFDCGEEAPFSHRISDETDLNVVGGAKKYQSLCRSCYNAKNRQ